MLTHEPPSQNWYSKEFLKIVYKYKSHIIHNFLGHRHTDQFVLYVKDNEIFSSGFIPPSFLPSYHDPAFRIYRYNHTHVDDYIQYTANLTNIIETNVVTYKKRYSFRDEYGFIPNTKGFNKLYNELITGNRIITDKICNNYYMTNNTCTGLLPLNIIVKL